MGKPFKETGFFKAAKKIIQTPIVGKAVAAFVPGGNIVKNLITPEGGEGTVNSVKFNKDITLDVGKLFVYVLILLHIFGVIDLETLVQLKELSE